MTTKKKEVKELTPIEYIVMLIVGQQRTFDEAYKHVDAIHQKQYGKPMERKRVADAVVKELNKELRK